MALEVAAAGALFACLVVYALTAGADFGGGVWDLLASGPRAGRQRDVIARALAPIWEANHVWLVLAVVILFMAFPPAFAAIATWLHIPLGLMLLGVVARGSAFVFRSYSAGSSALQKRLGMLFAIASVVTPVMLGVIVGAIASGRVPGEAGPLPENPFLSAWLAPFPLALGFFTLTLFAFLAAVYLTLETSDPELREDFRVRALAAGVCVAAAASGCLWLAGSGAPLVLSGLTAGRDAALFQAATAAAALGALLALAFRRWRLARALAAGQVALIVSGWALAQAPYLVPPTWTIRAAAAPPSVLGPLLGALGVGLIVILPAFAYLFLLFKSPKA